MAGRYHPDDHARRLLGPAEIPEYAVISGHKSGKKLPLRAMRISPASLLLIAALCLSGMEARAQSLLENGNFDNPTDPLKGWVTDYAWTGNSYYVGNKQHVSVATEGARKNVVKVDSNGDAGVKIECRAFPLEPGFKYVCSLDLKCPAYRIYFAGYQWAPGVHPHDNPELGELRMIYQSKAAVGSSNEWKTEKLELPGVALSEQAIEHLKKVRYLTIYIWMAKPGFVDNVTLTKVADPAMKF
jgi:hypothetical protein